MSEKIQNFLTKKRIGPIQLIRNKFSSSEDPNKSDEIQNYPVDIPDNLIQLLRDRLDVLDNSYKKGINVKENLRCFEEKLIELKETRSEMRNKIGSILFDARKSLAEKYGEN